MYSLLFMCKRGKENKYCFAIRKDKMYSEEKRGFNMHKLTEILLIGGIKQKT